MVIRVGEKDVSQAEEYPPLVQTPGLDQVLAVGKTSEVERRAGTEEIIERG